MIIPRFDYHLHTDMSNIRVIDAINKPKELIDYAIEIGLSGICFSEHEHLGNSIIINKLQNQYKEKFPNFKIAHGNEIYLTDTRSNGQKYYHFLFIALDSCGFKMLTELSSSAWLNGYYDRGLYRVPTLKTEVEAIINKYGQGHIYASTSCIGGYIGQQILTLKEAEIIGNIKGRKEAHDNIVNFILWCINTFGENNFALEVQPGISEEQLIVNNFMPTLAKVFNLPVCLTSDAHFLKESDRAIHKAFLNSKEAEREVDSFYQSCWLHTQEENLRAIASTNLDYEQMCKNSIDIMNRIEDYSLLRNQEVPTAIVPYFPKEEEANHKFISYPTLDKLSHSDNEQERAWVNLCYNKLKEKNLANDTYMSRLEEEADTQAKIGKKLNTCIFAYPLFMRHYINLIWDCGSTVGCGRGSAGGGLSHWLLGITQTDPIKTKSYFWRFLNKSRQELPDLDIDICPSKREEILNKTREETGKLGCVHVCTYGALSTKAAIKAACFDEKTLVLTAEGEKKIIDIIPRKDKVLTTNGWETVQEKTYLDNKEVIAVKTKNSTNPYVFCTPEHEFLVIDTKADGKRNVGQTDIELAKQIFPEINIYNSQDNVFQRYQRNIVHCSPKWIQAKDIKQGTRKGVRGLTKIDRTIEQTQKITWKNDFAGKHGRGISSSISITEDFCELIGIFLAEGNISYNFTGINFTIHQKETNFKERILELMWNVFQLDNYGISTKKDNKALIIRYSSRQLGAFFKQLFNCQTPQDCTQWNKRVPQMLRKIHPYLQLQIIKGYFLGDGYASLKRTPIAKLTTVSKKMADDFINIYHRNFVQPSVDVEDYSYRPSITYDIVVYSEKAKNLYHLKYEDGIRERYIIAPVERSQRDMPVEYNGDLYMTSNLIRPVNELKNKKIKKDRVYCLVTPSHNFTVNSVIVHNCRGYTSEEYPSGIPLEEAEYLSSLIESERGFLWTLHDCFYGNEEKGRKPNKTFIREIEKYPGLKNILEKIEGLIVQAGIHASGVIYPPKEDYYRYGPFMKAKNGMIVTQYSLHDSEAAGACKIDWLVTEVQQELVECIQMLQEHGLIEKNLSLREAYNKYLAPESLPLEDDKLWDAIDSGTIMKIFQFDSQVGSQGIKAIQPRSVEELTAVNALIRLMAEDGQESPLEKYVKQKNNPQIWINEMDNYGLTKTEQNSLKKYLEESYGICYSQEQLMLILMDANICGFSMEDANAARKLISKKLMDKIPKLKEQVYNAAQSPALGNYVWDIVVKPSLGYSFARVHGYSYSLIACQCAYLATYFPRVYWNTACLRVDAGIEEEASTSYDKIAKAVGNMTAHGIKVEPVDINLSSYFFEPDEEHNAILYGLKSLNGVGGEVIESVIQNRPYTSLQDFINKTKSNKTVTLSLIKAGAFDQFGDRTEILEEYIRQVSEPKTRLTMQNFKTLMDAKLLPPELDFQKRLFIFNKALRSNKKVDSFYIINYNYYDFYEEFFDIDELEPVYDALGIDQKKWQKMYTKAMEPAKKYIQEHQQELLDALNDSLFQEQWNKYAAGNESTWEMDSMGYYYHEHELANARQEWYNIVEYKNLPDEPEVEYTFRRNGRDIPIYKTQRIMGTVIGKNNTKATVNLLTVDSGVVTVKFDLDFFAKYNRRISENVGGANKVMEQGFFQRGTLVVVNGYKRGGMFVSKKYKKTPSERLYRITEVHKDGTICMTHLRYGEEESGGEK